MNPGAFREVTRDEWPPFAPASLVRVLRSRRLLVQVHVEPESVVRLSVCRVEVDRRRGRWREGIPWEELMAVKAAAGYAECDAVEVFPAERDVVNVANMRHLWIPPTPIPFAWRAP